MATDTSMVIYGCPFCDDFFRTEKECRDHISVVKSDGHSGKNGHDLDRPLDILHPKVEHIDFKGRQAEVERAAEEYTDGKVPYKKVADLLSLPASYVAYEIQRLGHTPIDKNGVPASGKISTSWDDLTGKQQESLLAVAYFPDTTHEALAESGLAGHEYQSEVSRTQRKYGWMLSHPDIETPVSPTVETSEYGGIEVEGSTEEMLDGLKALRDTDESDSTAESETEDTPEPPEGGSSPDEPRGSPPEEAEADDRGVVTGSASLTSTGSTDTAASNVVVLDTDLAFETVAALIETGRYEEARQVFRRATGEEELDLRWEDG